MRKVNKNPQSKILIENLNYKVGGDNSKIKEVLLKEQNRICAYTEEFLGRADKAEIDHFNPQLKGKNNDGYQNWFLIKSQWNAEKSNKWIDYQPVLHPTDENFDNRIVYFYGDYVVANKNDIEAENLLKLLKLSDYDLSEERKRYIERRRKDMAIWGISAQNYFDELIKESPKEVYFIRAIETEFQVKIKFPQ